MPKDADGNEIDGEAEDVIEEVGESAASEEEEVNEFVELLGDEEDEEGEEVVSESPEEEVPEGEVEKPEEPEEEEKNEEEEEETPPASEEETPPAEEPEKEPEAKPAKSYEETRAEVAETLEQQYQFDDEMVELIRTEPEKALPKLAAKLMVDMHENMGRYLAKQMPQMVERIQKDSSTRTAAVEGFFKDYSELSKPEYKPLLDSISTTHRKMNPTMGAEQFGREIAAMAMIQLKIPFDPETGLPVRNQEQPAPIKRTPAGSSAAPTAVRDVLSEWDELVDDDD